MRIVAFGCSYTYGHGLEDCIECDMLTQGSNPSKLAFPSLLAKKLNCDCVNLGKSGNSNKEIWYDILNFDFNNDDIVVATWSYLDRFCIIKSDKIRRISPWIKEEKLYYMHYNNRHDMIIDFYGRLNHVSLYLNSIGLKNYNFIVEDIELGEPVWNKSNVLGVFKIKDLADDQCHPGPISHGIFADTIYTEIIKDL